MICYRHGCDAPPYYRINWVAYKKTRPDNRDLVCFRHAAGLEYYADMERLADG